MAERNQILSSKLRNQVTEISYLKVKNMDVLTSLIVSLSELPLNSERCVFTDRKFVDAIVEKIIY